MNKSNGLISWRLRRMADFLLGSGTRYRIHSPFLFDFIGGVIMRQDMPTDFAEIESLRKELLRSHEVIQKTDYGKSIGNGDVFTYPVSLKHLAMTSLTSRKHAMRLYRLVRLSGARRVLELGTSLGITAAYLGRACEKGRVVTLEGCPELAGRAVQNLDRLGATNVEVMQGRFEETLDRALLELGKVDVLYIDGDHRKEPLLANFEKCRPYLHNDSVVVIDDIHHSPAMEEAWEEIISQRDVTVSLDLYHSGWLFFRKESTKEHFRLRYL